MLSDRNRPDLVGLFGSYMRNKKSTRSGYPIDLSDCEYEELRDYWNKMFPGFDDDEYEYSDGCEIVFPPQRSSRKQSRSLDGFGRNGKKRHKRHGRGSRARMIDIRTPYYGEEEDGYLDGGQPKVIFYRDYHDKFDTLEFRNMKEFSDFCEEEGYFVPGYLLADMLYRNESHCCLNPVAWSRGEMEIMCEASYGELFYEACEPEELP